MTKSFVTKTFFGFAALSLAACAATPEVARNQSDPILPINEISAIPEPLLFEFGGNDLSDSAEASSDEPIVYVGEDSSDGPYSGFTPEPDTQLE